MRWVVGFGTGKGRSALESGRVIPEVGYPGVSYHVPEAVPSAGFIRVGLRRFVEGGLGSVSGHWRRAGRTFRKPSLAMCRGPKLLAEPKDSSLCLTSAPMGQIEEFA